MSCCVFTY